MRIFNFFIALTLFALISSFSNLPKPKNLKDCIQKYGLHYQKYKDLKSLKKVIKLIKLPVDSLYLAKILGEPIDMGFEYRYVAGTKIIKCPDCAIFRKDEKGLLIEKSIIKCCE